MVRRKPDVRHKKNRDAGSMEKVTLSQAKHLFFKWKTNKKTRDNLRR